VRDDATGPGDVDSVSDRSGLQTLPVESEDPGDVTRHPRSDARQRGSRSHRARLSLDRPWTIPGAVFVLAFLVRLVPLLAHHTLTGLLEYDDGVHFSSAEQLVAGHLPYRDFIFIQPPGVTLLLTPFALLAHGIGDAGAMAVARVFFIAVAATNAALIAHILRTRGRVAALTGGLLYAVWQATVAAEHTLLLEPLLTLAVLIAMLLIDRTPRWASCLAAGAVIGAATTVKLWMGPVALVLVWIITRRHGAREAVRFSLACATTFVVVCIPFVIAAPGAFVRQVLADQITRPGSGATAWDRLQYLSGMTQHPGLDARLTSHGLALLAVFGIGGIVAFSWRDRASRPWLAIGTMELLLIMVAPSFSYHYVDFPAGTVCVLAGLAVTPLRQRLNGRGRPARWVAAVTAVALGAALALSSVTGPVGGRADQTALASFVQGEQCVWTTSTSLLIALDLEARQIRRGCPYTVDPYGEVLDLSRGLSDRSNDATALTGPRVASWQEILRAQLSASSAVVADAGTVEQGWDPATEALFHRLYAPVGEVGGLTMYGRR